jgi:hypothetical protein
MGIAAFRKMLGELTSSGDDLDAMGQPRTVLDMVQVIEVTGGSAAARASLRGHRNHGLVFVFDENWDVSVHCITHLQRLTSKADYEGL